MNIVLASASPRRRELLAQCGLRFSCAPQPVDEALPAGLAPADAVTYLSRSKAMACAQAAPYPNTLILGADTIVTKNGGIFGKPKTADDARAMLQILSGDTHEVYTGVTLLCGTRMRTFTCSTRVTFYSLSTKEIDAYIRTGEPMDKAGAYGIQGKGGLLVQKIDGDYYTVVGLPIARLMRELRLEFPEFLEE